MKDKSVKDKTGDYVIQVLHSPEEIDADAWNKLLQAQSEPTPFMRHEYLLALHRSGSAVPETGWTPRFLTLRRDNQLVAACALYVKTHSFGEYVFDHAWASAYARHGLAYYPKAILAVPFTPVQGCRLLACTAIDRTQLIKTVIDWCESEQLSSLHLLFGSAVDIRACQEAGLLLRHSVQFHWKNMAPMRSSLALVPGLATSCASLPPEGANSPWGGPAGNCSPTLTTSCASLPPEGANSPWGGPAGNCSPMRSSLVLVPGLATSSASLPPGQMQCKTERPDAQSGPRSYLNFDDFLASLTRDKRKKIQQERRKVAEAGVRFRWARGTTIGASDWTFFYHCYERTYLEHGNAPYLTRDFFRAVAATMTENWLLFVAERHGRPIASSLIALHEDNAGRVAYGRYWGALERVDCLHFEACYYQPLQWCITHGYQRFEGGAQGEHKMARALLPVKTDSAHWLAEPAFAAAVARYLERESEAVELHLGALSQRSPLRSPDT